MKYLIEKRYKIGINYIKNDGILIIAGKGHEETQTYKNKNYSFNDKVLTNYAKIYKIINQLKSKYKSNIVFDTRLLKKNDIFIGLRTTIMTVTYILKKLSKKHL